MRSVDTSARFSQRLIVTQDGVTDSHGPGARHAHAATAVTNRLDFEQAIQQAAAIRDPLQRRLPEGRDYLAENFQMLAQDLRAPNNAMLSLSDEMADSGFMASHPIHQYLGRRYRLEFDAMTWEPEEYPSDNQWRAFFALQAKRANKLMIRETAPLQKTIRRCGRWELRWSFSHPA